MRDRALIAIGCDTLCRRSELVALNVEDCAPRAGGGGTVLIRRSKTDPFGKGRVGSISRDGWRYFEDWLVASGLEEGPLFRRIYQDRIQPGAIGPERVPRLLKALAGTAGLDEPTQMALSGHSMRVGAAQDLAARGRDIIQIMRAGGWKSTNIVGRYIENAVIDVWD
jgi:integrase/recombinase XerD